MLLYVLGLEEGTGSEKPHIFLPFRFEKLLGSYRVLLLTTHKDNGDPTTAKCNTSLTREALITPLFSITESWKGGKRRFTVKQKHCQCLQAQ